MDDDKGAVETNFKVFKRSNIVVGLSSEAEALGSIKQIITKEGFIYTSHDDKHIRAWSELGECLYEIATDHNCSLMELRIGFLYIVTNNIVRAFDVQTRKVVQTFKGHTGAVYRFVVSGGCLYTVSADLTARAWDIKTGACVAVYEGHTESLTSLDVYEGLLITAGDKTIRTWKAVTIQELAVRPTRAAPEYRDCIGILAGHQKMIFGIRVYDGILYSASVDGTLRSWDLQNQKNLQVHNLQAFGAFRVDFRVMYEDHVFLFSNETFQITLWNLKTGKTAMTFNGHRGDIRGLKCKHGYLYTASADRTAKKWSIKDGSCLLTLRGHTHALTSIVVLSNSIITGSEDGTLACWSVSTEENEERKAPKLNHEIARLQELGMSQQFVTKPNANVGITKKESFQLSDDEKKALLKEIKKDTKKDKKEKKEKKSKSGKNLRKTDSRDVLSTSPVNLPDSASSGWYVGAMDRQKSEQLLSTSPFNAFLVRIGSVPGCFALSKFSPRTRIFNHVLITTKNGGFLFEDSVDTKHYVSLEELVSKSPEVGKDFRPVFGEKGGLREYDDFGGQKDDQIINQMLSIHLGMSAPPAPASPSSIVMDAQKNPANFINYNLKYQSEQGLRSPSPTQRSPSSSGGALPPAVIPLSPSNSFSDSPPKQLSRANSFRMNTPGQSNAPVGQLPNGQPLYETTSRLLSLATQAAAPQVSFTNEPPARGSFISPTPSPNKAQLQGAAALQRLVAMFPHLDQQFVELQFRENNFDMHKAIDALLRF